MNAGGKTKKDLPFNLQFSFALRDDRSLAELFGTRRAAQVKYLLHTLAARLPNINVGTKTLLADLCWKDERTLTETKKLAVAAGWVSIPHQGTGPGDASVYALHIPEPPASNAGSPDAELPASNAGTTHIRCAELPASNGGQREQLKKTSQVIKDEDDDLDLGKGIPASPAPGSPAAPDLESAILAKYPDCDLEETQAMLTRLRRNDLPGHNFAGVRHPKQFVESRYPDLISAHRAAPATDPALPEAVDLFVNEVKKQFGIELAASRQTMIKEFGAELDKFGLPAKVLPWMVAKWVRLEDGPLNKFAWRKFTGEFGDMVGRLNQALAKKTAGQVTPEERAAERREYLANLAARRSANEPALAARRAAEEAEEARKAARDAARRERMAARKSRSPEELADLEAEREARRRMTPEERAELRNQRQREMYAETIDTEDEGAPCLKETRRRRVVRRAS